MENEVIRVWIPNKENGYRAYRPEFEVMFWNDANEALRLDGVENTPHEYQTKFGFDTFDEAVKFIENVNVSGCTSVSINDDCYSVQPDSLKVKGNNMREHNRLSVEDLQGMLARFLLYTQADGAAQEKLANLIYFWEETGQNIDTKKIQIVAQDIKEHSQNIYTLEQIMYLVKTYSVRTGYVLEREVEA